MGKRNKRARTILKRMSILGIVPSLDVARRFGIIREVEAEIQKREEVKQEEIKLKEQAEAENSAPSCRRGH